MIQGQDMEVEGGPSMAEDKEAQIREELLAKMAHFPRETAEEIVEFFVKGGVVGNRCMTCAPQMSR